MAKRLLEMRIKGGGQRHRCSESIREWLVLNLFMHGAVGARVSGSSFLVVCIVCTEITWMFFPYVDLNAIHG